MINRLPYMLDPIKGTVYFSIGLYLFHLILAVLGSRGFYADGSNFFLGMLSSEYQWAFWDDPKHIRLGVNLLNQLPASLLIAMGVDTLSYLRFAFNFGLFFTPVLIYFLCALMSYRAKDWHVFVCAQISLVAFAMPSEMFVLNQAFTAAALCWLLLHYAILNISLRRLDYVVIILIIAVLFRSHESMLLWGAALVFASLVGIARKDVWKVGRDNLHQYLIACGGLLHAMFVGWWQFSHPVGQQTESYLQLVKYAMPVEMWQGNTRITLLLVVILTLLACIYIVRSRQIVKKSNLLLWGERLIALCAVYVITYGFMLFMEPSLANPTREFQYRFLITFGTTGMMLFAACLRPISLDELFSKYKYATLTVSFCFIGAIVWQMANSVHWSTFQRVASHTLGSAEKIVISPESVQLRLESAGLAYLYRYRWSWTWPVFGLSLHNSKNVLRVYRPEDFDEYFKLPKGENLHPYFPFVQFKQGGYFNFGMLRDACNRGECD